MAKEFHYFNMNALGESIRYILHYTKQNFADVRHDMADWPDQKIKDSLPFGQLPLYKEGDRSLNQSLAIAKYAARGTDLIPEDPWQQAVVESFVFTIYDYWFNARAYIKEIDPNRKSDLKKKLFEETIDFFFTRFEKHLEDNGGYFIGKLSWAEFVLCGIVESTEVLLGVEIAQKYPTVFAAVEKVRNLPGVKEHIATRGPYSIPELNVKVF